MKQPSGKVAASSAEKADEAKLGTLAQMFQDVDKEVLSSILFEQCGGDLDLSIAAVLTMNEDNTDDQGQQMAEGELMDKAGASPEPSSLLNEAPVDDKPDPDAPQRSQADLDKESQDLIEQMLQADQMALMQQESEELDAAEEVEERKLQAMVQR